MFLKRYWAVSVHGLKPSVQRTTLVEKSVRLEGAFNGYGTCTLCADANNPTPYTFANAAVQQ